MVSEKEFNLDDNGNQSLLGDLAGGPWIGEWREEGGREGKEDFRIVEAKPLKYFGPTSAPTKILGPKASPAFSCLEIGLMNYRNE